MQSVFLSQSTNHWQVTDDLLKKWFYITSESQDYNIFVIFECLAMSESENNASYDIITHEKSKRERKIQFTVKKKKCMKSVIKKKKSVKSVIKKKHMKFNIRKRKNEIRKQSVIKTEKNESFIQSMQKHSQSVLWKWFCSDLSSSLSESIPTFFAYHTRQWHELNEKNLKRITQYD